MEQKARVLQKNSLLEALLIRHYFSLMKLLVEYLQRKYAVIKCMEFLHLFSYNTYNTAIKLCVFKQAFLVKSDKARRINFLKKIAAFLKKIFEFRRIVIVNSNLFSQIKTNIFYINFAQILNLSS